MRYSAYWLLTSIELLDVRVLYRKCTAVREMLQRLIEHLQLLSSPAEAVVGA